MAYKVSDRMQQIFLPPIIDDYVGPQDPVRVYDAFIDTLDFKKLGIPLLPKPGAGERIHGRASGRNLFLRGQTNLTSTENALPNFS